MGEKIRIAICIHKNYSFYENNCFFTLLCGAFKNKVDEIELKDNNGDNISEKNNNYSELTGMYWLWKNVKSEYKGLFHYRRYLLLKKEKPTNIKELDYKEEDVLNFFKDYDILVPERIGSSKNTLEEEYKKSHISQDWDKMKEVIKELYPDYYNIALEEFNQRKFYLLNMLITRAEILMDIVSGYLIFYLRLRKELKFQLIHIKQESFDFFLNVF